MFGTKPEKAGWAGWQPSVDRPAKRRANTVTAKVRGRPGDRKNHLGSGRNVTLKRKGTMAARISFCGQELSEE